MTSIEAQLNEALAGIARLEQENAGLKVTIHELQIAKAASERADMLRDSMLPGVSVARLNNAFANSTDNAGLKQAINAELRYMRAMSKQDLRVEKILGGAK